jgi:hypothetical protein
MERNRAGREMEWSSRRCFLFGSLGCGAGIRAGASPQKISTRNTGSRTFDLVHTAGKTVSFRAGDSVLFEYQYDPSGPKTYVHPLCSPKGLPVTLDGPDDHVHHRGVMLAWSNVNGFDFWGEVNPGAHGQIVHQRFEQIDKEPMVRIRSLNHWIAMGKVLLSEHRALFPLPLSSDFVWLEWQSELVPVDEPVTLSAGEHVYNGLGIRFAESMNYGNVLNSHRTKKAEVANGQQAIWCTYYGLTEDGGQAGVVIFDHPDNPRYPTPFFVMNEPFGYLSAAPTFREPFHLPLGRSLRLRYAVGVYVGMPDPGRLDSLFHRWSQPAA